MTLIEKIEARKAKVGVIGLGYVGLPLVIEFCKAGFQVTGFMTMPLSRNMRGPSSIQGTPLRRTE